MSKKVDDHKIAGHQGDVHFKYMATGDLTGVEGLEEVSLDEFEALTVVRGEATNHHHVIEDPSAVKLFKYRTSAEGLERYALQVNKPTRLIHYHVKNKELTGEHNAIDLKPGPDGKPSIHRLGNQRMYSSESNSILPNPD